MRRPFLRYYDLSRRQPVSAKSQERAHGFIYGSAYGRRVVKTKVRRIGVKQSLRSEDEEARGREGGERGGV